MRSNTILQSFSLVGLFSAVLVGFLWLTGCRQHTSLVIETGNPLRFVVSGPGTMTNFQVTGPDLEREPNRQGEGDRLTLLKVYWEVASSGGTDRSLDKIGPITYGKVPEGFVQIQPPNGVPPPPLVERDLYNVRFSVNDGDGINRFFAIRDGRIVAEGER
jgi:hypothetical protein